MKKILLAFAIMGSVILISNCGNNNLPSDALSGDYNQEEFEVGNQLVETYCIACHSHDASMENRLAPPMIAVKQHYVNRNSTLNSFAGDMSNFIKAPTEAKTKMPNAVKKFGLMAALPMSEDQIHSIATYLFYADLKSPKWLKKHQAKETARNNQKLTQLEKDYLERGKNYATQAQMVLGKNLKQAIQNGGTSGALSFCNENALSITDSLATQLNANIKRVSDLNRNPSNMANLDELAYILQSKKRLNEGLQLSPSINSIENKMVGYYPIITNAMCLQCHGKSDTDINPVTNQKIKDLYPADKAISYTTNELRGIWVIEMEME